MFPMLARLVLGACFCLGLVVLAGCGGDEAPTAPSAGPRRVQETILSEGVETPAPPPQFTAGSCRIYTNEPGWSVFVDGYPVRTPEGAILQTPCRVEAAAGSHAVSIARSGRLDQSRQVRFADDAELVFETANIPAGESVLLTAPYLDLAVGSPITLNSLNSTGKEFDPFLSPDGRGIVFAADRPEGRGIYSATRTSPLHPFEPPTLLRLTSSNDQAASPSINGDATMIVYTVPAKARLRAFTRPSPLAEFEQPQILLSDEALDARYPSAQITASGDRVYFTREVGGIVETRVAFPTPGKPTQFGNVRIVSFPGEHPRLSQDGLRQYLFDGRTLRRARRQTVSLPFLGTEKVCELTLPRYQTSGGHRQFCVSEDEQWLIYADDPVSAGSDLWIVRLANGPGWGLPLSGATIGPRVIVAAAPQMKPQEEFFEPPPIRPAEPEPPPDPRSLPLPYVGFRAALQAAAAAKEFTKALELIDAAQSNPELRTAAELIEWDRQDVQHLIQFWQDVQAGVRTLKPGDRLRFGSLPVEFEKFADGVITAKARSKSVDKPLIELDAAALVTLADPVLDPQDAADMLRAAVFLTYAGDGSSSRRQQFLKAAGAAGVEFTDRLVGREAELCRMELARENIAAALSRIEAFEKQHAGTPAAEQVVALREALYTRTEWQRLGGRRWQTGPQGEYAAAAGRVDDALLVSPYEVTDFQLSMEYRTTAANGQGGVYFLYGGRGKPDAALKVQLSNDAGIARDPYCTGALFGITAPKVNAAKPLDEWNTFQMTVRGTKLTVTINRQEVLQTTFDSGDRGQQGYVALDGVAGGISYRKVILSQ